MPKLREPVFNGEAVDEPDEAADAAAAEVSDADAAATVTVTDKNIS